MAITVSRLDGQTLGFSLTAPSVTADVISLDIVSGALTSAYLSDLELLNLKPAVEALFSLVPSAQRAAGALGMLQRLVTVAPAAAATLTQSAVNTAGSVYALRATISAAPSQFIAHLPFSADGQLAWATGIDVAGPALPLSTANGGTGINGGSSNGVFSVSAGVGGATPLVYANRTIGAEVANTIPVTYQLRNGSVNFTTAGVAIWCQFDPGSTLANITVSAGAEGQVFPMADFATSGRFAMLSGVNGIINLNVTNVTAGETNIVLHGPGPGTNNLFIGGEDELIFAP